jgi:hypothetical protein
MSDPFFHDEKSYRRMADNPQLMAKISVSHWLKLGSGLAALALIAAIWLNWRFG